MRTTRFTALLLAGLLSVVTGFARAAEPVTADDVLQAHIEAIGGSAALAKIQSRQFKTTISSGLLKLKMDSTLVRPNLFENRSSFLGFDSNNGYDGQRGWIRQRGKTEVVQGVELSRAMRGQSLDWDNQFRRWYPKRERLPDVQIDGAKLRVVEMSAATGEKEIWRFDAGTGLLRQIDGWKFEKGEPPVKVLSTFDDYRVVDGVRLPHRVIATDGKREFKMVITAVEHNKPTAPIRFPVEKE